MGFVVLDLATAKTVRSKFHPYMEHNLDLTVQPAARAEHHQPRATATLTAPSNADTMPAA
jgi:hypothetical protein